MRHGASDFHIVEIGIATLGRHRANAFHGVRHQRVIALLDARTHVLPEDVQAVAPAVVSHRLALAGDLAGENAAARLLRSVAIP